MSKTRKIFAILLSFTILLTLIFIWGNSLKTVTESGEQSSEVYSAFTPLLNLIFGEGTITHSTFRKLAHVFEYFVLGVQVFALMLVIKGLKYINLLFILPFGIFVSVIDECLQLISNRGASVTDVFIDLIGFMLSGVIMAILTLIIKSKINKKYRNKF